ncbi:DUF480 domain-containing protein [Thalassoroseus pseudoceratinae]|uniref:DUF480 domain-containing protein n=1 Tax=Thalassoroseus pseudoceratinae TaxID=2713176 RepID=UPI00141EC5FE|nr:DUF480 domain-containing protein [Thalassoroseus pseudoceratinae]
MLETPPEESSVPLTELTRQQRRVIGTLIEKGLTTPDSYPLTLKALTTGCNQKSNRDPVTGYSEDQVADVLEQLREMGLVGEIHTDSGRAPRYRHYIRHRLTITEPQLAIMGELLLRGKQRLGELRARASRMVPIENLEQLREALAGMLDQSWVQSSGNLERRGTMVDHGFYRAKENMVLQPTDDADESQDFDEPVSAPRSQATPAAIAANAVTTEQFTELQSEVVALREDNQKLRDDVLTLRNELGRLGDDFQRLRQELGG